MAATAINARDIARLGMSQITICWVNQKEWSPDIDRSIRRGLGLLLDVTNMYVGINSLLPPAPATPGALSEAGRGARSCHGGGKRTSSAVVDDSYSHYFCCRIVANNPSLLCLHLLVLQISEI
jgi:hypothetical protein